MKKATVFVGIILVILILSGAYVYMQYRNSNAGSPPPINPAPTSETPPTMSITESAATPIPTVSSVRGNYLLPSDWKIVKNSGLGISLCLAPKWDFSQNGDGSLSSDVHFYRDPQYAPRVTSIRSYPYSDGSRRQEYLEQLTQYEPDKESLIVRATVKELMINNVSALEIAVPGFSTNIVIAVGDKLYAFSYQFDGMVESLQTKFRQEFLTMVGCTKKI